MLILEYVYNPTYYSYLWVILTNASKQDSSVVIYDCEWMSHKSFNRNINTEKKYSDSKMRENFLLEIQRVTEFKVQVVKIDASEIQIESDLLNSVNDFSDADRINSQFGNSLRSVFVRNYFSSSNISLKGSKMKKFFKIQVETYFTAYFLCQRFLLPSEFDLILISNGRFPSQTASRVFAEENFKEILFYEHGSPEGHRFHLAPYQYQEFIKMQQFAKEQLSERDFPKLENVIEFANKWLVLQSTDKKHNKFILENPSPTRRMKSTGKKPLAVIFNSSIDERFSNMGLDLNGWKSQKQATSKITKRLLDEGFDVVVRIHPNTANKSWWDLINLVSFLESECIDYILPWEVPTSYELLEKATLVLTWGSTISMEAVARGVPTIIFGRTMFDNLLGVPVLDPEKLGEFNFKEIDRPIRDNGRVAIYYVNHRGFSLSGYCEEKDLLKLKNIVSKYIDVSGNSNNGSIADRVFTASKPFIVLRRIKNGRYSTPNDFRTLLGFFLPGKQINSFSSVLVRCALRLKALTKDGEVSI